MTTKFHKKVSSALAIGAICALLAFIVLLWCVFAKQGGSPHNVKASDLERNENTTHDKELESTIPSKVLGYANDADTELVRLVKVGPKPIEGHDFIYDLKKAPKNSSQVPPEHHTGHFRHLHTFLWDPHPEYTIRAFGLVLRVSLRHEGIQSASRGTPATHLHVTHIHKNVSSRVQSRAKDCFYSGYVVGDDSSKVMVSLCGGMTGYIRSKEGTFYIEPAEEYHNSSAQTSVLHRIHRMKSSELENSKDIETCDTRTDDTENDEEDNHIIFDDIFTEDHHISKRSALLDYQYEPSTASYQSKNREYFIEILVVVDKTMYDYHRTNESLIHYILTLMSHVSLLYKDATIGNPVSLFVKDIIILPDKIFVPRNPNHLGVNSGDMLRNFCSFQQSMKNFASGHDVAILLTREVICRNTATGQCDTLGLAELGTMCSKENSCAIIKDKGLPTSYTIAHELGHVLSIPHDDDLEKCARYNEKDSGTKYIMGRMIKNDSKPWLWSTCSRKYLTNFLESNRANCLLNKPNIDLIDNYNNNQLPGEDFSADKQCELIFGPGLNLCTYMPKCTYLWCELNINTDGGCQTHHQPWADGTICGQFHWCMRGECVPRDLSALQPIAGGWGPWKIDGPCSRTCGGGVRHVIRDCDSPKPQNGGAYCLGPSTRYESCHTEACDENAEEFRELQCAKFNGNTMGVPGLTKEVKWVPKYEGISPEEHCILYCRVAHTNQHYLLADRVVDGTKCGFNSHDLCVAGTCRRGGCDNKLGSTLKLDACGICGGDNSKCEQIEGQYHAKPQHGYSKVVRIPKGSSNLDIRQHGWQRDGNYLALVDSDSGQYVMNGNYILHAYPTVFMYGGVTFSYTGTDVRIERINSSNSVRLKKDLLLELLSVDKLLPPNISYSYMIARGNTPLYSWQLYSNSWGPCNKICSGVQRAKPLCTALGTGQVVQEEFCENLPRDGSESMRECNKHCRLIWRVKHRFPCSSACGSGLQTIVYQCVRVETSPESAGPLELLEDNEQWGTPVDEQHCSDITKPPELEHCEGKCEEVRWKYDEWSECSHTCAGGVQHRTAYCTSSSQQSLPPIACAHTTPPVTSRPCNTERCPTWSVAEWTECNATCSPTTASGGDEAWSGDEWKERGKGWRMRPYYCHTEGRILQVEKCDQGKRPKWKEECEIECPRWDTGPWQPCDCLPQQRIVRCLSPQSTPLPSTSCSPLLRPNTTRACTTCSNNIIPSNGIISIPNSIVPSSPHHSVAPPTMPADWRSGPWSQCSKSCGMGVKKRQVVCQDASGDIVEEERCEGGKPRGEVQCEERRCGKWNTGDWSECTSDCLRYRLVLCQADNSTTVPSSWCAPHLRPTNTTPCTTCSPDTAYRWRVGAWSACSRSCGRGVRSRAISCVDTTLNATVVDSFCSQRRPRGQRVCRRSECTHLWVEGPWTDCTKSCGEGMRYRNVTCHRVMPHGRSAAQGMEHTCDPNTRPTNYEKCFVRSCDIYTHLRTYTWFTGPWKSCSHPCGQKGRQIRHIHCQYNGKKVPKKYCSRNLKPRRKQKCNQRKCSTEHFKNCLDVKRGLQTILDGEYDINIGENNNIVKIYCHKMAAAIPEEFLSLKDDGRENYAEIYGKQLLNPDSCPEMGRRLDRCHCRDDSNSGLTVFYKIKLNITSLEIITDDFTFSRQIYGIRIPFASAGDCYSRKECPQGRFAINLSKTGLEISDKVIWKTTGIHASMSVVRQKETVSGKCGGYCGKCAPTAEFGLRLVPKR